MVEIVKIQRSIALWKRNVRFRFFESQISVHCFTPWRSWPPKWPLVIVQYMAEKQHRSSGAFRNWRSLRVILLRDVGMLYLLCTLILYVNTCMCRIYSCSYTLWTVVLWLFTYIIMYIHILKLSNVLETGSLFVPYIHVHEHSVWHEVLVGVIILFGGCALSPRLVDYNMADLSWSSTSCTSVHRIWFGGSLIHPPIRQINFSANISCHTVARI